MKYLKEASEVMRTKQSYQINFLSLLKKVSRLGNERNMKDQHYVHVHACTHTHAHTGAYGCVCQHTGSNRASSKSLTSQCRESKMMLVGFWLVPLPPPPLSHSPLLSLSCSCCLSLSVLRCISLVPVSLSPSLFCALVPWPPSTPPTHTLMCHGLFRASLWCGRELPSPGQPGATSAPPPSMSQAAETQPRH